jgi:8-oxo-dGTP diphosphatase
MAAITWHEEAVPTGMSTTQVYGILFAPDGRVMVIEDRGRLGLPGGKPESIDIDAAATLARECMEEATVSIADPVYLGYQRIDETDGTPPYAQTRYAARITEIHPPLPDPDSGRTYRRHFVDPAALGAVLNWGDVGERQAAAASCVAVSHYRLPSP